MNPVYQQVKFINSAPNLDVAPPDEGLEIAFVGRSNSGKSSAINALTQQKNLARTSKIPGRTQLINFFELDEQRRLIDLPGYGYAKVPETIKKDWQKMISSYINQRKALCGIMLMMDIRHPLTEFDWRMLAWCEQAKLPVHILLTKSDKLKYGAAKNTLLTVQRELGQMQSVVTLQLFSALNKTGVDDAHQMLDVWFKFDARQAIDDGVG